MRRTDTYKLETIETGGYYFASSDFRRFTTLDYNLKTYIGIVGNGVLRGWDIKVLSSRTIKINPGCGIISGLYTESPWYLDPSTKIPKRKNQAIIDGDDIFEEIPGWSSPDSNSWAGGFYNVGGSNPYDALVFDKLGPEGEDNNFDGVVDGVLQPNYKEPPDNYFTNPFVKAIPTSSTVFLLENNSDNYVFANRISIEPNETFANFFVSSSDVSSETILLLAKISVRDGSISKIDYTGVLKAKELEAASSEITKRILKEHHHGGSENWDPPRIKLNTDIRQCFFVGTNNSTNVFRSETVDSIFNNGCIFAILSKKETTQESTITHSHYYEMDQDGNGITHYIVGLDDVSNFHYHTIQNGSTINTIGNYNYQPHIHSGLENTNIENTNEIVIRINDKIISSQHYQIYNKNFITFVVLKNNIASFKNGKFKCEFSLMNGETYLFEEESNNVSQFITDMINNFSSIYSNEVSYTDKITNNSKKITVRNPFSFKQDESGANLEDGEINYIISEPTPITEWPVGSVGSFFKNTISQTDLFFQSVVIVANNALLNTQSLILPNVSRFTILSTLIVPQSDKISAEILNNVEVSGVLSSKNMFFIDAEKFSNGEFSLQYIPFLTHGSYFSENANLFQFNTFSNDSVDFRTVAIFTSSNENHSHKIILDKYGNGKTTGTYINNQLVVYETATITVDNIQQQSIVLVDHIHEINNNAIQYRTSSGLNQYNDSSGNSNNKEHTHYIVDVPINNSTSIFYIGDNGEENTFLATSNGLLLKPKSSGYKIDIEGSFYYYQSGNLLQSLLEATYQHYLETQRFILFSSDFVRTIGNEFSVVDGQIIIPSVSVFNKESTENVVQTNDDGTTQTSTITTTKETAISTNMIVSLSNIFLTPRFAKIYSTTIDAYDADNEDILYYWNADMKKQFVANSQQENQNPETPLVIPDIQVIANFHKQPIWCGILLNDGKKFLLSQKKIIRNVIGEGGEYWEEILIKTNPFAILRKIIKCQNYLFICGDNGVKYTSLDNSNNFSDTTMYYDTYDIIESPAKTILATTKKGLYKSDNYGFSWNQILTTQNLKEIVKDNTLDKTSVNENHFHYLLADINGDGYTSDAYNEDGSLYHEQHVHSISSWEILYSFSHIHTLISTLFIRSKNGDILKSENSGTTWNTVTQIPNEYLINTETIFAAFDRIFVGGPDGLIYFDGTSWNNTTIKDKVFCFNWTHNLNGFYIGCNNIAYVTYDGINFTEYELFDKDITPTYFQNGTEVRNGFVFNNLNSSVNFREPLLISSLITVSPNYDIWKIQKNYSQYSYDVLVDYTTILSTKTNEDYRKSSGVIFEFDVNSGIIDFGVKSKLSANVRYGDSEIHVDSSEYFDVGKEILISKLVNVYFESSDKTYTYQKIIRRKIKSISSNSLIVDSPIFEDVEVDSVISQIYKLEEQQNITVNYYSQKITNTGQKAHEQIENSLSKKSTDIPFRLSEVFINNFNQLSLYAQYAIPDITNNFKNWKCYFMRYDRDPNNENYIGNFFDTEQSRLQSSTIQTGLFNPLLYSSINVVYFGRQDYKEMVFVGTNNGLYAGIPTNNFNHNWFLVPTNIFGSIHDIMSLNQYKTIIISDNGAFINENSEMTQWTTLSSIIQNSAYFIKYRWVNFGNEKSKNWWELWEYEKNLKDPDLTNTLILGGKNYVLYSLNNGDSWLPSSINNIYTTYEANSFLPLMNGSALLVLNNATTTNTYKLLSQNQEIVVSPLQTSILSTNGIGHTWNSTIFNFSELYLIVENIETTEYNNTKITFQENKYSYSCRNSLIGLPVFINNIKTSIVSNSWNTLVLKGTEISTQINTNDIVKISPHFINGIIETREKSLIAGTESGLFYDKSSYLNQNTEIGTINGSGKEAIVTSIDVDGFVVSTSEGSSLSETTTTKLICILQKNVDTNELENQNLIFSDEIEPSLVIVSPIPNESIESTTITINLNIVLFDVNTSGFVAIQLDNGDINYFNSNNFVITNLAYGRHKIRAFLTDINKVPLENYSSEKTIYFTNKSNNTEPSITVTYPENNETIKSSSFYAKVNIYNFNTFFQGSLAYTIDSGSKTIVPYQPNGVYSILFDGLSIDKHSVNFMLLDTEEKEIGVYQTINFTLSNDYPSIFITSPLDGSTTTFSDITLNYNVKNFTVPSNGKVKITVNNSLEYYSSDPLSYVLSGLSEGLNTIKVQLVDNQLKNIGGDFTSDSTSIVVNTYSQLTPSLSIFSPQQGSIVATGSSTSIYFSVNNFNIPVDGGILIYLNNQLLTFWTKQDPYILTIKADGTYTIDAFLAKTSNQKLSNSQANASVTISSQTLTTTTTTATTIETLGATQTTTPTITTTSETPTTQTTATQTNKYLYNKSLKIISNSTSSASGLTEIEVEGNIDQSYLNMSFNIRGESSILYVEYVHPVTDHEFDGGKVYVKGDQQNNVYRNYNIKEQIGNRIKIEQIIDTNNNENILEVQIKQTIILMPKTLLMNLAINLDSNYSQNELSNRYVYIEGYPELLFKTINNTQRNILLDTSIDPSWIVRGSTLYLHGTNFVPLKTFNNTQTTIELNHYHKTNLIDDFLSGAIDSINKIDNGHIVVYTKNAVGCDNPIILANPDIFKGASVAFYTAKNSIVTYYDIIDSVYDDRIIIKTENINNWNIDGFKTFGIDKTFIWSIDAKNYGITTDVYYNDFSVYKTKLISDSLSQQNKIYVEDTSLFSFGDDVQISNNKGVFFYSRISDILNDEEIEIEDLLTDTFLVKDDSCISIYKTGTNLDADFVNFNHSHIIKDCEISLTTVNIFDQVGYYKTHNHSLSNLIPSVTAIVKQNDNGRIIVGGSSNIVYYSDDSGSTWLNLVNLKDYIDEEIYGKNIFATSINTDQNNDVIIGTNVGIIVRQGLDNINAAKLEYPFTDEFLPSSSSSSSESSDSSFSSESTSTSLTTQSSFSSISNTSGQTSSSLSTQSSISSMSSQSSSSISSSSVSSSSISSNTTSSISSVSSSSISSSSISSNSSSLSSSVSSYSLTSGKTSSSTSSCSTYWHTQ